MTYKYEAIKVDKGFELVYWKLSYRRKFIRTLWMIPYAVITLILIWWLYRSIIITSILAVVIVVTEVVQLIYTYKKWKK